jgi:hypothetical protein
MVDFIVRSTLGQLGSKILDFYLLYSIWINGLILLYTAALILGRLAFRKILYSLCSAIVGDESEKQRLSAKAVLKAVSENPLQLQEAMKKTSSFIISKPGSWVLYPKTANRLEELIDLETLTDFITKNKKDMRKAISIH